MKIVISYVALFNPFNSPRFDIYYGNLDIPVPDKNDVLCQIIDLRERGYQIPGTEEFIFPSAILGAKIVEEKTE